MCNCDPLICVCLFSLFYIYKTLGYSVQHQSDVLETLKTNEESYSYKKVIVPNLGQNSNTIQT